ncbi:hypothetical protein AGMMS49579_10330 [Spirochaetia bacterium]|nr:hypothetical protein AGMMS49579_10330 [Spirochaetia bacterium]
MVSPADRGFVIRKDAAPAWSQQSENEYFESRQEGKIFPVQETGGHSVIAGDLFYQGFRQFTSLFRFGGSDKVHSPQPGNIITDPVI